MLFRSLKAYPNSSRAYYDKARIAWNRNDREGAMNLVRKAISLEPENTSYKETLEKLPAAKDSDLIFNFNMTAKFDQL